MDFTKIGPRPLTLITNHTMEPLPSHKRNSFPPPHETLWFYRKAGPSYQVYVQLRVNVPDTLIQRALWFLFLEKFQQQHFETHQAVMQGNGAKPKFLFRLDALSPGGLGPVCNTRGADSYNTGQLPTG